MLDLRQQVNYVVSLSCDNRSTIKLAENPVFFARTKHVQVHYHFLREKVLQRDIKLQYIGMEGQTADVFTKGLNASKFEEFRTQLGMMRRESRC
ncbi:hypothetical protein MLD38_037718 [Melastoma candidum]|uniref:Uncharacterized protein n=1 Tax=Melastoma candidum TaxID=119954 RepID=A0ACB9LMX3_9MYRT|nr:hypothetical protein MLD38_037718 [Melastoma candidum]